MNALGPYIALAFLSAVSISFQLVVVQVFSFTQWYHFAFMVISLALLGGGMAGVVLFFGSKWFTDRWKKIFPGLILLTGGSMVGSIYLSQWEPLRFDSFLMFTSIGHLMKLPVTCLAFFVPFFFSALAVGLMVTVQHEKTGRVYFWNLVGSGFGALGGWALMWLLPPELMPFFLVAISVLAFFLCLPQENKMPFVLLGIGLSVLFLSLLSYSPPVLRPSEYKDLSRALLLPNTRVEKEMVSPYGRWHIVRSPLLRYAPGLSFSFQGVPPSPAQLFANGDAAGPLFFEELSSLYVFDYTLALIPWSFGERQTVLVLTYDTGALAAYALYRRAASVTAVTPHPVIAHLIKQNLPIRVFFADPRSWLEKDQGFYDLIYFPVLGRLGGGGAQAVAEDHLFTIEGIKRAFEKLTPQGVMFFITWEEYPLRYPLKLFATIEQALKGQGYWKIVRGVNQVAFVVKKTPFSPPEVEKLTTSSQRLQFRIGSGWSEVGLDVPRVIDAYPFHVGPATDDRPYIHQFLRPRSLSFLSSHYGWERVPFFEIGYLLVIATLINVIVVALLFIFFPLFAIRLRPRGLGKIFIYFSCLGLGYMLVEMAFIQRFVFYFGSTASSMTVIVALMLISSGVGSWIVDRIEMTKTRLLLIVFTLIFILCSAGFFLTPVLIKTAGTPGWMRLILSLLLVFPLAFIMGMPFPIGIKALGKAEAGAIPWAWGVNGFFSVLGACLAVVLSVEAGFRVLMWTAALAYTGILPLALGEKRS
ncbi:MAG: hypothetical protein N2572_09390 [Syntrophales bacterium]|nr:hypothetical protein [Syntrophales bacterium]